MSSEDIQIFIGSEPAQVRAERVLEYSIRKNTKQRVEIHFMRAGDPGWDDWQGHGPTQFTLFRFAIPHLMNFDGLAIYLDCDMLVLGDIAELATYFVPGSWNQHPDPQGDCVSVIDCHAVQKLQNWPTLDELKSGNLKKWDVRARMDLIRSRQIPSAWNQMDRVNAQTRLVHFTSIETQPWKPTAGVKYREHPCPEAEKLWFYWEAEYMKRGGVIKHQGPYIV